MSGDNARIHIIRVSNIRDVSSLYHLDDFWPYCQHHCPRAAAPLSHSLIIILPHSITVSLPRCRNHCSLHHFLTARTTASQCHCLTAPLPHSVTVSLPTARTTASQRNCLTAPLPEPLPQGVTVSLPHCRNHCLTVFLCDCPTARTTASQCLCLTALLPEPLPRGVTVSLPH
jgi:hypothetical protein